MDHAQVNTLIAQGTADMTQLILAIRLATCQDLKKVTMKTMMILMLETETHCKVKSQNRLKRSFTTVDRSTLNAER